MENETGKSNSVFQDRRKTVGTSGGSRGGARGARPPPPILVKKEEMIEGKMADRQTCLFIWSLIQ